MDFIHIILLSFLFIIIKLLFTKSNRNPNLPPSPAYSFPVIGHLHLLKQPLHRTLHSISQSLGNTPIYHLRLGNRLVYVVSSNSIAEECFTKNDVVLANRPELIMGKNVGYKTTNMIAAPYGDHWRNLRRIAAVEIFSSHRISTFLSIRKDEIRRLITLLSTESLHEFVEVEMKSLLANLAFNNIIMMVAGKRYYGGATENNNEAKLVRELISEVVAGASAGNLADYLPIISRFSNYEKETKKLGNRMDAFLQKLVDEKRTEKKRGQTLIDLLLSLQETQPDYFTDVIIKGIILALVVAGSDTSAVTIEWAMSNLLNHPEILKKARAEIDDKIGLDRLIEESDIVNLHYLQNIVSETLRLYPAVPLLLPHYSSDSCKVAGYDMPRGTMLLTNAWAMHRDPGIWEEPQRFKPERFEKEGEAQKLMPFGMGRRSCPGAELGKRLVSLALGSLVQCFEWERVGVELVDMVEGKGITMPKATPLRAMCKTRGIVGGTDTSALTVEWAMSNLLNHPQVLETTKQNIDTQMESSSSSSGTRRLLKEEDLVNMNYLNNVVSETLRLYPVAPLMVPHLPSSDCVIGGFDVPRDTIVLVNVWTIHRDPNVWDDPTSFKPERFEGKDQFGHYNGKMMPFGLGRRVCPGLGLANRVTGLVLGSLVQCFEWDSGSGGPVDMTEGRGLSMPKAEPLVVTCKPREWTSDLLFFGGKDV